MPVARAEDSKTPYVKHLKTAATWAALSAVGAEYLRQRKLSGDDSEVEEPQPQVGTVINRGIITRIRSGVSSEFTIAKQIKKSPMLKSALIAVTSIALEELMRSKLED